MQLPSTGPGLPDVFHVAGTLLLLLGVLFLAFWLLRKYGHKAGLGVLSRGDLKLESQLGIGPKKSVMVVRFLNKRLVLGVTDSRINLLTQMDIEDEHEAKSDFASTLHDSDRGDSS